MFLECNKYLVETTIMGTYMSRVALVEFGFHEMPLMFHDMILNVE